MKVAVLGAGYAGLTLARNLENRLPPEVDLVLVNDAPTHLLLHEVHRVVRRPSIEQAILVPLEEVLDRAEVRVARVDEVDSEAGVATLGSGEELQYDYGAVCLGSETDFHSIPGVERYGTPLKCVEDAERIREQFLPLCESGGRVVVGGAGLSGVQIAGELAALGRERSARVEVVLLEQAEHVAPEFPQNFREAVHAELDARNVVVRTGAEVRRATADELHVDGETLAYDQFVWTGGIAGSTAMSGERPAVRSDLRLTESTFVVGDAARVVDADGKVVPASAAAAVREAKVVADNLVRLVEYTRTDGDDFEPRLRPYRFDVPGWIVSVGDGAVAQVGPTVLTGAAAKAMKASVGAGYLGSVRAMRNAVDLVEEEVGTDHDSSASKR